jgi:hypothetical protein
MSLGRFGATASSRGAPLAHRRSLLWSKLLVQDPSNNKSIKPDSRQRQFDAGGF